MTPGAALAFAAGSLAGGFGRWALAGAVQSRAGDGLPWGILAVNLLGCLLAGAFDGLGARLQPETRLALVAGFCGAFTTFSALMLDAARLPAGRALLYVAGSAAAGLLCVRLGAALAGRL
jgi:fluoride exporter